VAPIQLFAEGKIDAMLAAGQEVQELWARKLGHVVVSGIRDRPWSQYFCCIPVARTEYIENYPNATKHILRALLKAADIYDSAPKQVAQQLFHDRRVESYEYTAQMLAEIPYEKWREFDTEDSVRFFSLRPYEAGVIKSTPQQIIADGTDWSFLKEIKREMKT